MRLVILFLFLFLPCIPSMADNPTPTTIPSSEFVWNKWDTKNFIILSIDKSQGLQLKNKIESVKLDFEKKYGSFEFPIPCKVICVPDDKLLSRFFNIDTSRAEVRRDSNGDIIVSAIWMDFGKAEELQSLVANICLESSKNSILVKRGVSELEKNTIEIRSALQEYFEIDANKIFLTNEKTADNKFNKSSALICLLLRKEFGASKFVDFMSSAQDESALSAIYGFSSLESFSKTANRYFENLSKDIKNNKTPDKYLRIE